MKDKKIKIIILSVLVLIFFGALFLIPKIISKEDKTPAEVQNNLSTVVTKTNTPTQTTTTTLQINGVSYTDEITSKMSVNDFMNKLQSEGKINFTEKYYLGMGNLVTGINGINNNGTQSWIYYVNGVEAQVGVSTYKINPGDVVSWKYEKSDY